MRKLTDDERFMKEALRQAMKARALEEVPIGCVIVHDGNIIAEDTTGETRIKIPPPTRRSTRSGRQAKSWETGGWKGVPFTLPWSPARCVPGPLCRPGLTGR